MNDEAKKLRERIEAIPKNSHGRRRYTAALRQQVVQYTRATMEAGRSQAGVSLDLGIHQATLAEWIGGRPARKHRKAPVKKVIVEHERQPGTRAELSLTLREGHRIDGLDLNQLEALLKVLA